MHQPTAPCAATAAVEYMPLCSLPRRGTISAVTKHVKMRQNAAYRSGPVGTPYIPLTGVRMCHTRAGLCVGSMHQPTAPCAATTAVEHMLLCSLPRCSTICHILTFSHRFSQIPAQRTLHHISAQVSTLGLHLALANVLLGITTAH